MAHKAVIFVIWGFVTVDANQTKLIAILIKKKNANKEIYDSRS